MAAILMAGPMKRIPFAIILLIGFCASALSDQRDDTYRIWVERAEQGDPYAQFLAGLFHYSGNGAPQDYAEAAAWWRRAAEQGFPPAQIRLAGLYLTGTGVTQNAAKAVAWYRAAAEQGQAEAQYALGLAHEYGTGTAPDLRQAIRWYRLAANQDHAGARKELYRLSRRADFAALIAGSSGSTARTPQAGPQIGVQIASYRSMSRAERGWLLLRDAHPDLLGPLAHHVTRVDLGPERGVYHRLYTGPVSGQAAAQRLCDRLRKRNVVEDCLLSDWPSDSPDE